MDENERKQITDANADHVRDWFEASDFKGEKLDTGSGKKGKKADWKFTKQDLAVLCEVKTIFSGGQSGFTEEQAERRRLESKQKFARFRDEAIADGTTLLTHKDEQDYLEGKIPYVKGKIRKEEAFNQFLEDIHNELTSDQTINQLPFSISITIDGMYVAKDDKRKEFFDWLKGYVLWAHKNHNSDNFHTTSHFTFEPQQKLQNGEIHRELQAFIQMSGPYPEPQLEISFLYGGVPFYESKILSSIEEAVEQLRSSNAEAATSNIFPVIALWSASNYLHFDMLLITDATEIQLGNIPQRYYLIDRAFLDYPDLVAVILFQLKREGSFWNPSPEDKVFPTGIVITNPHMPDAEIKLKETISENCMFITGIASDPLNPS